MDKKMSKGLTQDIIITRIIIVFNVFRPGERFDDRGVSELYAFSGATFRAHSVTRLPRAKALGCSVRPFYGQSAVSTIHPSVRFGSAVEANNAFYLDYGVFASFSATLSA